jgi:hypothetical protein
MQSSRAQMQEMSDLRAAMMQQQQPTQTSVITAFPTSSTGADQEVIDALHTQFDNQSYDELSQNTTEDSTPGKSITVPFLLTATTPTIAYPFVT